MLAFNRYSIIKIQKTSCKFDSGGRKCKKGAGKADPINRYYQTLELNIDAGGRGDITNL
jgi:hypothetical protein